MLRNLLAAILLAMSVAGASAQIMQAEFAGMNTVRAYDFNGHETIGVLASRGDMMAGKGGIVVFSAEKYRLMNQATDTLDESGRSNPVVGVTYHDAYGIAVVQLANVVTSKQKLVPVYYDRSIIGQVFYDDSQGPTPNFRLAKTDFAHSVSNALLGIVFMIEGELTLGTPVYTCDEQGCGAVGIATKVNQFTSSGSSVTWTEILPWSTAQWLALNGRPPAYAETALGMISVPKKPMMVLDTTQE